MVFSFPLVMEALDKTSISSTALEGVAVSSHALQMCSSAMNRRG